MISKFLTLVCESFSEGLFTEIRTMGGEAGMERK